MEALEREKLLAASKEAMECLRRGEETKARMLLSGVFVELDSSEKTYRDKIRWGDALAEVMIVTWKWCLKEIGGGDHGREDDASRGN